MELRKSTKRKGQIYEPSGQGSNRSRGNDILGVWHGTWVGFSLVGFVLVSIFV